MTEAGGTADRHGIDLVFHPSPRGSAPTLLVLLPGLNIRAADFVAQGFVAMLHDGEDAVDVVIAEPDLDCYIDGTITRRLLAAIADLNRQPYRRIWLGGISLGCFGALLAAFASPEAIDGVVLLSPFLGSPGLIAEVERAPGFAAWQPGIVAPNDGERRLLAWLKTHLDEKHRRPRLYLGYGRADRFAAGAALVGAVLPPPDVRVVDGVHDWPTWAKLWREIVDARPFR